MASMGSVTDRIQTKEGQELVGTGALKEKDLEYMKNLEERSLVMWWIVLQFNTFLMPRLFALYWVNHKSNAA